MNTFDMKQFEEFAASLQKSLEHFKSQGTELATLKATIATLESNVLEMTLAQQRQTSASTHGFGFHEESTAKSFVKLMKSVFIRDPAVKDMTEGVDSEGGYTVPSEYRNVLLTLMEQYGVARQRCTIIPMGREELVMPKLTGGVRVYWVGENKQIGTTQPEFGEFRMIVKKMAALVPMTSELLDDTTISIANLLATLFAQALAKEEDRVTFTGDVSVSDPFNGVLYDPDVNQYVLPSTKTAFTDVTADDFANVTALLSATLTQGAEWYIHRTVLNIVRKLKNTDGTYIFADPTMAGQPATIWGYPVNVIESMPNITTSGASKPFCFFGNLSHYYIGDRKQLSVARSEHVGFAQDKVFLRVIQREGMSYAMPETGIVMLTAAS